ncbi:hypothetical protein Tsubulata_011486 [Turnera subulata]|uniref:Ricin B lectin domain-containing protein n=1 Tax=Turnera subulata TaxID=218843 RepID=A0A9Q0GII1_9ROSI|nr:hypothetical protein Tsubulata_011486 [Turnera subulata]
MVCTREMMKVYRVVIAAWVCWVLVVGTGRVCLSPAGLMLSELGRFSLNCGTTDDEYEQERENNIITTRISGPDGLCVEVANDHQALYHDDHHHDYEKEEVLLLSPCKSNTDHSLANQLWTSVKEDGTLRSYSNNWCVTMNYSSSQDDIVVVQECSIHLPEYYQHWELTSEGCIKNKASGLFLTVDYPTHRIMVAPFSPHPRAGDVDLLSSS